MVKNKDTKIIELISNENTFDKGFNILVSEYQEPLYWHIRRLLHFHEDTDDVLQNTFVKIFKHIKNFKGQATLFTWLYRIATNESISFLRKRKMKKESLDAIHLEQELKADKYFDGTTAQIALIVAIETLTPQEKIVFNLKYFENLSYKDISDILDKSIGTLKAQYFQAKNKIIHSLENTDHYVGI